MPIFKRGVLENGKGTFGKNNRVLARRGRMVIFANVGDQVFIGQGMSEDSYRSSPSATTKDLDVLLQLLMQRPQMV
jgi:hypothetical protein